jgi:hypothetical protein
MIGVGMAVNHAIKMGDPGIEQLGAQIGRCIDEKTRFAMFDQNGHPAALIFGLLRAAHGAIAAERRNAGRCAASQNRYFH